MGLIFKAFALLSAVLAIWFFAKSLLDHVPAGMDQVPIEIRASAFTANLSTAFFFLASGLALWWMAEVVDLLSRIATNTASDNRGRTTERALPRNEPAPQKRMVSPAQSAENPPRYEL